MSLDLKALVEIFNKRLNVSAGDSRMSTNVWHTDCATELTRPAFPEEISAETLNSRLSLIFRSEITVFPAWCLVVTAADTAVLQNEEMFKEASLMKLLVLQSKWRLKAWNEQRQTNNKSSSQFYSFISIVIVIHQTLVSLSGRVVAFITRRNILVIFH